MKEMVGKRTPLTETWKADDGGEVLRSFVTRQYYGRGSGMERVDSTLVADTNGGFRTKANDWTAHLPATVRAPLSFDVDGEKVRIGAEAANSSPVSVQGEKATYRDVWPATDLEYVTSADAVKEDIVLKDGTAPAEFTFRASGVILEPDPDTAGALRPQGRKDGWRLAPLAVATAVGVAPDAAPRYVLRRDGRDTLVTVRVDARWLAGLPTSAFPVRIDPSFSRYPTWNWWALKTDGFKCTNPTQDYCWPKVGATDNNKWRTAIRFPFDELRGKIIQGAWMYVYVSDPVPGHNIQYQGLPVGAGHATCVDQFGCLNLNRPQPWTTVGKDGWLDLTQLYQIFQRDNDWGAWLMMFGAEWIGGTTYKLLDPNYLHIDFTYANPNTPPPAPAPGVPADASRTLIPQQSFTAGTVADADGQQVKYRFLVTDSGQQGQVSDSGYLDTPQWTIPDGVLQDGVTYSWRVCANDTEAETCSTTRTFTVDSRTGKDATQSFDTLGSVDVDLATGNLVTSAASHSMSALGGSLGVSLQYDTPSLARRGLVARYYSDPGLSGVFPADPTLTRVDQNVDFTWGTASPASAVLPADGFLVRWDGYFLPPATGTYNFGTAHSDDGLRITINDDPVLDAWSWSGNGAWSTDVDLNEGQAVPISIEYREATGFADVHLLARGPASVGEQVVRSEWLRTEAVLSPNERGLIGAYYSDVNASGTIDAADGPPFLVRTDPQVSFEWPGAVVPGAPADRFLARWSGDFTPPTSGSYTFGAAGDDNLTVSVDDIVQVGVGCCQALGAPVWGGGAVNLTAGLPVRIQVDFAEATGYARAALYVRGAVAAQPVPPAWLSPKADVLPDGWHLSVDQDGDVAYERLRVTAASAVLTAPDGSTHQYASSNGVYKAPDNEYGTLTRNVDGTFTLLDGDGRSYLFATDGSLTSVTSPLDDRKPAALQYIYGGNPSKLLRIEDGVDATRRAVLQYAGLAGQEDCGTPPTGFDAAPTGFLCAVLTSDGRATRLRYKQGRLTRLELPGGMNTDWGYDEGGRINRIRDPLAFDAIGAGFADDSDASRSIAGYDPIGRVESLGLPQPDAAQLGPEHTYEYRTGASLLHVSGLVEPNDFSRKVIYDSLLRTTSDTDNQNRTTTTEWHPVKDLVLASVDPIGMKSTTLYDDQDRPTDTYGPATADWFGPTREPASHVPDVPHSITQYDGGIPGLAVAYFGNKDLTGAPGQHGTGVGPANGDVVVDWGGTPPIGAGSSYIGATGWGTRLTGFITIPEGVGASGFRLDADDAVRLYINDQPVIDDWTAGPKSRAGSFTPPPGHVAGARYRIRLDFADFGGGSYLKLYRTAPGGVETSSLGGLLSPGYGLATRATTVDQQAGDITTATSYDRPENGVATATTVDPGGLALTTHTTYEAPGAGFLRRTSRVLPAGNSYTYGYYGATETADNPCTPAVEAVGQAGMLRLTTDPDPDGAGQQTSRRHEVVYDAVGRPISTRTNDDGWTCTSYDTRGRAVRVDIPPANGAPARVVTTDYAVGGNPLVTATSDAQGTIQTTTDLLGRVVVYRDALGNTTATTYDRNGLVLTRSAPGGTERYEYDVYQRPWRQYLADRLLATTFYDPYGRVASVDYTTTRAVPGGAVDDVLLADGPTSRWPGSTADLPSVRDTISNTNGVAGPGVRAAVGQIQGGGDALGFNIPGAFRPVPIRPTSVRFPGNGSYVKLAHTSVLNTLPLTVEAWIQTTQSTGTRQVVGKWTDGTNNGWRITTVNGHVRSIYAVNNRRGVGLSGGGIDGGYVADGKPHHLAFTINTTGGSMYVDGVKKVTGSWVGSPSPVTNTSEFRVGLPYFAKNPTAAAISASTMSGNVDDVLVHTRTLSAAEIASRTGRCSSGRGRPCRPRPPSPPTPDTSTQLWWKLDETTTTAPAADASGKSRTGTYQSGPVPQAPALPGYGYRPPKGGGTGVTLNGTNAALTMPSTPAMSHVPLTIEAWITTTQLDTTNRTIIAKQTKDPAANGWALALQNGELLASWTTPTGKLTAASAGVIADGRPHHLLWSVTTTKAVLYIDGRPQLTQTWTAPPGTYADTEPLRVGVTAASTPVFTAMSVDDVSVHTQALSPLDAARRAVYPHDDPQPAVVDLRLDETAGAIAANTAPGQPNGTYAGAPSLGVAPLTPDTRDTAILPSPSTIPAPYTVEAWVRTTGSGAMTLLSPTSSGIQIDVDATGVAAGIPAAGGAVTARADVPVEDGSLHQIAVVVTTTNWAINVDGVERADGPVSGPSPLRQNGQALRLGAPARGAPFSGWIEEADLYPTALDSSRLHLHWNKTGFGTAAPSPVTQKLLSIDRDQLGRTTGLNWQLGDGSVVSDAVTRSASGRVIDGKTDGVDPFPGGPNYLYDAAGRLTRAHVPGHDIAYGFGDAGACPGAAAAAGLNTNRTSTTDNGQAITYCYDGADRLVSTTDTSAAAPQYDSHGNTTRLGQTSPITFGYDSSDRHIRTSDTALVVTLRRDAQDRLIERTSSALGSSRYGYTSSGDTADLVLDGAGRLLERIIALPAGVLQTQRAAGDQVWSFPNIHGDVMVAAADGGTRSSSTLTYDPFGQPLVAEPDNESGALDNGWLGQHERPTDSEFALVYVEMGARAYMPALGRFLQVDPVEGGSANAYDYINQDPSNQFDVDGRFPLFHRDNLRLVIRGGKKALHLFNHHFRFEFTPRQGWHINLDWKHVPTQLRHIFIAPVIDFLSRRPFGPILIIPKDSILEQMLNPSSGPRA